MIKLHRIDYFLFLAITCFIVCFFFVFPQHIYIADEISYVNQALHFFGSGEKSVWNDVLSGQQIEHILVNYPLGTSVLASGFYALFGYPGFYIANIFYLVVSFFFIYLTIREIDVEKRGLSIYILLCIPAVMYAHMVMSELPSLLVVSVGFYFFFRKQSEKLDYIIFGAMAGLSVWFRELNLLVFLIPTIFVIRNQSNLTLHIIIGFLVGLLPRLISSWLVYGNAFHVKDPGYSFGIEHVSHNLPLYAISLLFLFPFILYPLIRVKSTPQKIVNASVWMFVLIHLLYGYDAAKSSGGKSILLTARFLIPLIPLFVISLAMVKKEWMNRIIPFMPWLAIAVTIFVHGIYLLNDTSVSAFKELIMSEHENESIFLFDAEDPELLEILTPLQALNPIKLADVNNLTRNKLGNQRVCLISQRRLDTEDREAKQKRLNHKIDQVLGNKKLTVLNQQTGPYQNLILYLVE